MIFDNLAQELLGFLRGDRGLCAELDFFVRDEAPGIEFWITEFGRILLHPGTCVVVLVATHLHREKTPSDQIVVRLPSPGNLTIAEPCHGCNRSECFVDGIGCSLGNTLIDGHQILEFGHQLAGTKRSAFREASAE